MSLDGILCFKHRRKASRDNTVKYNRRTLQLLPGEGGRTIAKRRRPGVSAHPEPVEGCWYKPPMVRQAHHERAGKGFAIVPEVRQRPVEPGYPCSPPATEKGAGQPVPAGTRWICGQVKCAAGAGPAPSLKVRLSLSLRAIAPSPSRRWSRPAAPRRCGVPRR